MIMYGTPTLRLMPQAASVLAVYRRPLDSSFDALGLIWEGKMEGELLSVDVDAWWMLL